MDHLINVSKGHIPNLGALGPLLHVEKFVVVGGWVVVVVETHFSVKLEPQAEQYDSCSMILHYDTWIP